MQKAGQVYFEQGDYRAAISRFEQAIKADVLSLRVVSGLRYNLAQLYLVEEKPDIALGLIKTWFDGQQKAPQAAAFALRARIYMALGRLAEAEQDIRLAVSKAAAKTDQPNQAWTRILLSILLQQERYDEARPMLEDAVQIWPGVKSFWQHLSSIYYMAGEEELGFAARQAMHVQGMLTQGSERASMAQLYLYHNVPIKAAALLKAGLDDGTIEANEKHYEMLAQAYMHSREWQKAIAPLTKAAELSDDGAHYQQLAQAYVQDEQWAEAEPVLVKALAKGGLKDEADNWLLLGIVQVRLEKYEAAIKAFRKAGDDDDIAKDAFRWIRNIERRLAAANSAG